MIDLKYSLVIEATDDPKSLLPETRRSHYWRKILGELHRTVSAQQRRAEIFPKTLDSMEWRTIYGRPNKINVQEPFWIRQKQL